MKSIKVKAPATIANLVCGFDVLGLCVEEPFDVMEVTLLDEPTIIIRSANGYDLPADPQKNTAGAPLLQMQIELGRDIGFDILIHKNIKPGSGVGSSAASAAGAVVAANILLDHPFTKEELVRFAMVGEEQASGVQHADNVAPCIWGGVTLIRSAHPLDIVSLDAPPLFITIVHPQVEVRTEDARKILRQQVLLKDAIRQWGNIAGLVAGFMKGNYGLISRSLEDVIIEPVRGVLVPGLQEVKKSSMEAGALGGGISGSGPSIFMLSSIGQTADAVGEIMKEIYHKLGIESHIYVTRINNKGVEVIH